MKNVRQTIDTSIQLFQQLIHEDPTLREEFQGSLAEFFGGRLPDASDPATALASARRHLEWFVFERHGNW